MRLLTYIQTTSIKPVLIVSVLLTLLAGTEALAAPGDITLASTSDTGVKGNADSSDPSLSADGTKVAFGSLATNLDPADTDSTHDVYVKDLATGNIILASTSDTGTKGSGVEPSLSADGTVVAFRSSATNLDPGDTDFIADVYVKDLATGDITLASTSDAGTKGNSHSYKPSLSADGTRVAFSSDATNLDPGDTDGVSDVYVKNLATGDITLASTSDSGTTGNDYSLDPSLSADGTVVAFWSFANNLDPGDTDRYPPDVYVKDLVTGDIALASTSDGGVKGNDYSSEPILSADGTRVAFWSFATNLDPGDTDGPADVYVKDLVTGEITLVSTSDGGVKGEGPSYDPSLSADGRKVAFWSHATNLDPGDPFPNEDAYVKDLLTGDIALASTSDEGVHGNGASLMPSLSADGTRVAFSSDATNLYPGDSTWVDVYVKEPGGAGPLGPGAAPSPKEVSLKAKPKKVEKGDKTKLTVLVSPCGGHEGDMVDIYKGSKKIATKTTDSACSTKHRVKMHKTAKFQAISPVQDADHLAGTSTKVRVKVTN